VYGVGEVDVVDEAVVGDETFYVFSL